VEKGIVVEVQMPEDGLHGCFVPTIPIGVHVLSYKGSITIKAELFKNNKVTMKAGSRIFISEASLVHTRRGWRVDDENGVFRTASLEDIKQSAKK
jgi:hypothetical protein